MFFHARRAHKKTDADVNAASVTYGIQPFESTWQDCMDCLTAISAYTNPVTGNLAYQKCSDTGNACHNLARSVSNRQEGPIPFLLPEMKQKRREEASRRRSRSCSLRRREEVPSLTPLFTTANAGGRSDLVLVPLEETGECAADL